MFPIDLPQDDTRRFELSFEVGWLGVGDSELEMLSWSDPLTTIGARAGYRLTPRVAIVLDYQHTHDSMGYFTPSGEFTSSFGMDRMGLGAKGDLRVGSWFRPYAVVEGVLSTATARFDDDPEHDDNATQMKASGLSGGVYAAVGTEYRINLGPLALAPYIELGYGFTAPTKFGELGQASLQGVSGQAGWGIRF